MKHTKQWLIDHNMDFSSLSHELGISVKEYPERENKGWLGKCIIVDIDGTLAHMTGRSPYDFDRVNEDAVDIAVANICSFYYNEGYSVILLSGRDEAWRKRKHELAQLVAATESDPRIVEALKKWYSFDEGYKSITPA